VSPLTDEEEEALLLQIMNQHSSPAKVGLSYLFAVPAPGLPWSNWLAAPRTASTGTASLSPRWRHCLPLTPPLNPKHITLNPQPSTQAPAKPPPSSGKSAAAASAPASHKKDDGKGAKGEASALTGARAAGKGVAVAEAEDSTLGSARVETSKIK
jgi:hypothetical protein